MNKTKLNFKTLNKFVAFSLAEMMVVMLIMSIVLAAMAPIVTSKAKSGSSANSSPWKWVRGVGPDAYFGVGGVPKAIIGQNNAEGDANSGKLIINVPANGTGSDYSHLLFKRGGANVARLFIGNNNLVLGDSQGSGQHNTAVGMSTLSANTGSYNTAVGRLSMQTNTTGEKNTALGHSALRNNTTGTQNTALGYASLRNNTTASQNTAVGYASLYANTTGTQNTAVGYASLYANTTGGSNTSVGYGSLRYNTTGAQNTALGKASLYANTTGGSNTALGNQSMYSNTTGTQNTAVGLGSLYTNTTGHENTAIGTNALYKNKLGYYNTAVGYNALYSNVGTNDSYEFGTRNTAVGYNALYSNVKGQGHVAIGYESLAKTKEQGYGSVAIGYEALNANTRSNGDIAIGYRALAKDNHDSSYGSNIAIGWAAMQSHTTGYDNTAIGDNALGYNEGGRANTAIGYNACLFVKGSNKTCIGYDSGPSSGDTFAKEDNNDSVMFLGGWHTKPTVYIPGNLVVDGDVILGRKTTSQVFMRISQGHGREGALGWNHIRKMMPDDGYVSYEAAYDGNFVSKWPEISSDIRLKYLGQENKTGLDKIKQLKVFNYTFKKDEKKTPHVGVIAQDLQKIFPNAVSKGSDGYLRIRMEDMFYALINAVKELDAHIKKLEEKIINNQKDIKQLKQENKELKARLDKLEAKLK